MTAPATWQGVPLEGLRLGAPLGSGSDGVAWAATTDAGEQVAVRLLADVDAAAQTRQQRRLATLRGIDHPSLVRVRTMPAQGDGRVVVTDQVPGPTLATVRTGRMGLPAEEVLAIARDLAAALAALHAHGLVHGDVAPSNVVLAENDDGVRPVLIDLLADPVAEAGTAGFAAPEVRAGAAPTPAADVWALTALCLWCTRVGERELVARELGAAGAQEPGARPAAQALAERLAALTTAAVQVPPPSVLAGAAMRARAQQAPTVLRPTRRRRARHRRVSPVRRAAVAMLAAAAVAVPIGLFWPDSTGESLPRPTAVVGVDLTQVVTDLVEERDAAIEAGDQEALAATTAPDSPARDDDLELLASLAGTQVSGLRTAVTAVEVLESAGSSAAVQAVLTQGAHERTSGGVTTEVAAQQPRCVVLALALDGPEWAVERVSRCE